MGSEESNNRNTDPPSSASDSGLLYSNEPPTAPSTAAQNEVGDLASGAAAADGGGSQRLPKVGEELGGYRLIQRIAAGLHISQFTARHLRLDRTAIVSFCHPNPSGKASDPAAAAPAELLRRFHASTGLEHPAIAATLDAGEYQNLPYVVAELVPGVSLHDFMLRHGPFAPDITVSIAAKLAQGLRYAWGQGMAHGGITPHKVILYERTSPKLIDFGLSMPHQRAMDSGDRTLSQSTAAESADVRFLAPELIGDCSPLHGASDVYALGCLIYWMLNGTAPYEGTVEEISRAQRSLSVPLLHARYGEVSPMLQQLWHRMMLKDQTHRIPWEEVVRQFDMAVTIAAAPNSQARTPVVLSSSSISLGKSPSGSSRSLPAVPMLASSMEFDPRHVVSLDLGCESTRASVLRNGLPMAIEFDGGKVEFPTAVWINGDKVHTGADALTGPVGHVLKDFKVLLGNPAAQAATAESNLPADVLAAFVLRRVNDAARSQAGYFRRAVLTVPSCYNDLQRKSLQDAAYIASLDVIGLINESTAVTIWLAFLRGLLRPTGPDRPYRHWLVVRLGKSSFEASVVRLQGLEVSVLSIAGDPQLGVADWDQHLSETLRQALTPRRACGTEPASIHAAILRSAEIARLSLSERDRVKLRGTRGSSEDFFRLTRAAFEVATSSLLGRVRRLAQHAVTVASLSPHDIDEIILTGGGAGIPSVQQTVREFAPELPVTIVSDPNAASHGALVWANMHPRATHSGPKISLQEVNAVDIGIAAGHTSEGSLRYSRIIAANTSLPCARIKTFGTQQQSQESLRLPLACLNELASSPITPLGECHIWYHSLGQYTGTQLKLLFHLSAEARLSVFAEPHSTGSRISLDIQRPVGLSEEQCVRWRDWMDTAILCGNI